MKDVAHHQHVGARQRIVEEVAGREAQALGEPDGGDVGLEDRLERRKVEAAAGDVVVRERDLDRDRALGAADVDHAARDRSTGTSPRSPCAEPMLIALIARANCARRSGSA